MARPNQYFSRYEWIGFWITFGIAFGVYLYTLAPNVGLEDSGEFLTASYNFGVPHPPGYPSWTLLAYLFEHIPYGNAAWRVNLMSAFLGALSAGILCLVTSKLTGRLGDLEPVKGLNLGLSMDQLARMAGIVAGLVFAFIDTMWSQAVIAEVYTLNSFFFTLLCLFALRWLDAPQQKRWLFLISFIIGIGITNHQTILLSGPAFLFIMRCANRELYRRLVFLAALGCAILAWQTGLYVLLGLFSAYYTVDFLYVNFTSENPFDLGCILSFVISLWFGCLALGGFCEGKPFHVMFTPESGFWLEPRGFWISMAILLFIVGTILFITDLILRGKADKPTMVTFAAIGLLGLGVSLYGYMWVASITNPPMNWGHVQSGEEFRHQLTRGQYERLSLFPRDGVVYQSDSVAEHFFQNLYKLFDQYGSFLWDLNDNFGFPLLLIAIFPFFHFLKFPKKERQYFIFSFICFALMGLLLVFLLNPKQDVQSIFINRVFYSLAHGVCSMWVGLGAIFLLAWLQRTEQRPILFTITLLFALAAAMAYYAKFVPGMVKEAELLANLLFWISCFLLALLILYLAVRDTHLKHHLLAQCLIYSIPLTPICMNWELSEMRGHDFGWLYGQRMLKDLDRNAVVYGGTDPGRFVPTYMIFVESFQPAKWRKDPEFDRRDLYIITQNALADHFYMNYIRDHYDVSRPEMEKWYHRLFDRKNTYPEKPLILPNPAQFEGIFNNIISKHMGAPWIEMQPDSKGNTRAMVHGLEGVFAINGEIAYWIFEQNKAQHSFYVEESYPLAWMYPYLEPAGLIMKINKEPIKEIDPLIIKKDRVLWKKLIAELFEQPAFRRDEVAQKAFSKLRCSIGGLYLYRKMFPEAEETLLQSLDLYPGSAETRSRLLELYLATDRFEEARIIAQGWVELDPHNKGPKEALNRVRYMAELAKKEAEMAAIWEANKFNPNFVFELINIMKERGHWTQIDQVIDTFLNQKTLDLHWWQQAIHFYSNAGRFPQVEKIFLHLCNVDPKNGFHRFNLGLVQIVQNKPSEATESLKKAVRLDSKILEDIKRDPRLNPIRDTPEFKKAFP